MKKILCIVIFVCSSVFIVRAQSKDEKDLAAVVEKLHKALLDGNRTILEEITSADLSYGHSSGKVENKTQFIERIASGSVDFQTINTSDQTIIISGKNGIVRLGFAAAFTDTGKPVELKIGVMMVWQKQKGKWILFARQGYKL